MEDNSEARGLLITGEIYHIFNKSIAEFKIFNNTSESFRMLEEMRYYQKQGNSFSFSRFSKLENANYLSEDKKAVEIIAYCIMPTHIHLVLKQLKDKGITFFMNNILNSYSRYFNLKHKRKGPLWEGRFKRVLVEDDEQLLHLTRYIHLNPVTAYLVDDPLKWETSSYKEYVCGGNLKDGICRYEDVLVIDTVSYKRFVEDRISYQRELAKLKHIIFE